MTVTFTSHSKLNPFIWYMNNWVGYPFIYNRALPPYLSLSNAQTKCYVYQTGQATVSKTGDGGGGLDILMYFKRKHSCSGINNVSEVPSKPQSNQASLHK